LSIKAKVSKGDRGGIFLHDVQARISCAEKDVANQESDFEEVNTVTFTDVIRLTFADKQTIGCSKAKNGGLKLKTCNRPALSR
jgi:hypothetical protein